jgi:hypothetical protein
MHNPHILINIRDSSILSKAKKKRSKKSILDQKKMFESADRISGTHKDARQKEIMKYKKYLTRLKTTKSKSKKRSKNSRNTCMIGGAFECKTVGGIGNHA